MNDNNFPDSSLSEAIQRFQEMIYPVAEATQRIQQIIRPIAELASEWRRKLNKTINELSVTIRPQKR